MCYLSASLKICFFFMPNNQPSSKIIFGKPASTGKNRRAEHSRDSHHFHRPGIRPFVDGIIENKAAEKLPQETELLDTFGPKLHKKLIKLQLCNWTWPKKYKNWGEIMPIGSMYGIFANIWGILMVNVTIYGIHGSYGMGFLSGDWSERVCILLQCLDIPRIHCRETSPLYPVYPLDLWGVGSNPVALGRALTFSLIQSWPREPPQLKHFSNEHCGLFWAVGRTL